MKRCPDTHFVLISKLASSSLVVDLLPKLSFCKSWRKGSISTWWHKSSINSAKTSPFLLWRECVYPPPGKGSESKMVISWPHGRVLFRFLGWFRISNVIRICPKILTCSDSIFRWLFFFHLTPTEVFFCFCVASETYSTYTCSTTFLDYKESVERSVGFQMFSLPSLSVNENRSWSSPDFVEWPTISGMTLIESVYSNLLNICTNFIVLLCMRDSFAWTPLVKQEYAFSGDVSASWDNFMRTLLSWSAFSSV